MLWTHCSTCRHVLRWVQSKRANSLFPPPPLDSCWRPRPNRRRGVISPRSEYSSIYSERGESTPTLTSHVGPRAPPKTRERWWEFGISNWEVTALGGVAPQISLCQGATNRILCGSKRGVSVFWGVREAQEEVYSPAPVGAGAPAGIQGGGGGKRNLPFCFGPTGAGAGE